MLLQTMFLTVVSLQIDSLYHKLNLVMVEKAYQNGRTRQNTLEKAHYSGISYGSKLENHIMGNWPILCDIPGQCTIEKPKN